MTQWKARGRGEAKTKQDRVFCSSSRSYSMHFEAVEDTQVSVWSENCGIALASSSDDLPRAQWK